MAIYCLGVARIQHAKTGKIYSISCDDLDWEEVEAEERDMGDEIHYEAIIDHSELGRLTWGVWEYPRGIENCTDTDVSIHKIIDNFDYGLENDPD